MSGPENTEENRLRLRLLHSAENYEQAHHDGHGKESSMTDHERTDGRAATAKAPRRMEYLPPEDSTETQPPYGSREITRWMVLDGRRVRRHASLGEAWGAARSRILGAAICMLLAFVAILGGAFALLGGVTLAFTYLLSPEAAGIAVAVVLLGLLLAGVWWAFRPPPVRDPLDLVRDRYDLSDDESSLSFLIAASVVVPVCLVAHYVFG